jgi:ADP-dependent NAD(P)H-hydrate dehydratase / NAD(P)H-hydrate epimerase
MKIVTTEQMRRMEREADSGGLAYSEMMERAGHAVAAEIARRGPVAGSRVVVLVGPGNNGGDGLVAARALHDRGAMVSVFLARPREASDANLALVRERGLSCLVAAGGGLAALAEALAGASVVVDALLGTGASRPPEGAVRAILTQVAASRRDRPPLNEEESHAREAVLIGAARRPAAGREPGQPRKMLVAVDLPSGLNADTGAADALTPHADLTVTFACPKRGHFLFPGAARVGELAVADIGISASLAPGQAPDVLTSAQVSAFLPQRPAWSNKGTFGRVLVVAGSESFPGAACLAASAATRVGAGLVTLACPQSLHPIFASHLLEVTYLPLPETKPGRLGLAALPALQTVVGADGATGNDRSRRPFTTLLLGPGLGQDPDSVALASALAGGVAVPYVLDADGLNALAGQPRWWTRLPVGGVLTPHPGEMARLAGMPVAEIEAGRWELAETKAREWGQVVVLKGAYTVIAAPDGRVSVNPFANPGLATAGSGDVLAGAIAGLLAQGVEPFAAAAAGAYLHALAGELARESVGEMGMVAGDLLPLLPQAIRQVRAGW